MARFKIDVTKALYDTDGYGHTLVQATPMQILTLLEGFYWLWDRASGKCLIEGMTTARLSNARPTSEDLIARRYPVAETRAFRMAQEVVQAAAARASLSSGHPAPPTWAPTPTPGSFTPWQVRADAPQCAAPVNGGQDMALAAPSSAPISTPFTKPSAEPLAKPTDDVVAEQPAPRDTTTPLIVALAVGLLGAVLLIPGDRYA